MRPVLVRHLLDDLERVIKGLMSCRVVTPYSSRLCLPYPPPSGKKKKKTPKGELPDK